MDSGRRRPSARRATPLLVALPVLPTLAGGASAGQWRFSAYYNLSRGAAQCFDYGTGLFTVGVGYRSIGYVGSAMNRATDVYRFSC